MVEGLRVQMIDGFSVVYVQVYGNAVIFRTKGTQCNTGPPYVGNRRACKFEAMHLSKTVDLTKHVKGLRFCA